MTFGQIISGARKKLGWSQKELAARIKKEDREQISPQYLNDIERDRRNPPSEYLVSQFARELKLSKEYLLAASGALPEDLKEQVSGAKPEVVERAFQAFRRQIRS